MPLPQSRLTGWEPYLTSDGNVLQSGARSRPENAHQEITNVQGWIARAVVLQVYYTDEDDLESQRMITADVRTYGLHSRMLVKVPVLQRVQGVHDQDLYIPRPCSQDLNGGPLITEPTDTQGPTPAHDVDGDHVLVGFWDNDPGQPFIFPFALPHPKSNGEPKAADGRQRVIRHHGIAVRWSDTSDFEIDATSAALPDLVAQGAEASASGSGGRVTIKTKDGAGAVSQVALDASGGVLVEAGGGSCKVELVKDATALVEAATTATMKGGALVELDAPLVTLAGPGEPVIKGASYITTAETALYAALTGYFKGAAAAWEELAKAGAPQKMASADGPAQAAKAWDLAIGVWAAASAASLSTKVTTG
jgi:hypothetical protein